MKDMKEKKRMKMKIGVDSVMEEKVTDMEESTIKGIISRMRKDVV